MQVLQSSDTFPSSGGPAKVRQNRTLVSYGSWSVVEGTQPSSVSPKLHGLHQIPKRTGRMWWVAGLSDSHVNHAKPRGRTPSTRQTRVCCNWVSQKVSSENKRNVCQERARSEPRRTRNEIQARPPSAQKIREEVSGTGIREMKTGCWNSEDEVRTWRIGLHEEGSASDEELNVQDTEHSERILGRNTNTRHAEEAVDLVASSSSQCAEWSKGRVAEPASCAENVLKKQKITFFFGKV